MQARVRYPRRTDRDLRSYDITQADQRVAAAFFGPDRTDQQGWDEGNPVTHADQRPDVPVLLVHGKLDDMVPVSFTEDFADALTAGGHTVTAKYPKDQDHFTILRAGVIGPIIADWLQHS